MPGYPVGESNGCEGEGRAWSGCVGWRRRREGRSRAGLTGDDEGERKGVDVSACHCVYGALGGIRVCVVCSPRWAVWKGGMSISPSLRLRSGSSGIVVVCNEVTERS